MSRVQGVRFVLDEKTDQRADASSFSNRCTCKLDPRTKVADLTVAKQQMVEIAKALSFNSQVLIMDEPTAALTDTEIEELFRIIRQLREKGVGVVYISHRLEELKQISDRITVMRDGHYVDTVEAKEAPIDQIISMMVGRTIFESAPEVPEDPSQEVVLEVQQSQPGQGDQGCQLQPEEGRNSGLCRADGRRAHRSGAGDLWRRSDRFGRDLYQGQAGAYQEPERCGETWHRLSF